MQAPTNHAFFVVKFWLSAEGLLKRPRGFVRGGLQRWICHAITLPSHSLCHSVVHFAQFRFILPRHYPCRRTKCRNTKNLTPSPLTPTLGPGNLVTRCSRASYTYVTTKIRVKTWLLPKERHANDRDLLTW